jgi:hypothetical protein
VRHPQGIPLHNPPGELRPRTPCKVSRFYACTVSRYSRSHVTHVTHANARYHACSRFHACSRKRTLSRMLPLISRYHAGDGSSSAAFALRACVSERGTSLSLVLLLRFHASTLLLRFYVALLLRSTHGTTVPRRRRFIFCRFRIKGLRFREGYVAKPGATLSLLCLYAFTLIRCYFATLLRFHASTLLRCSVLLRFHAPSPPLPHRAAPFPPEAHVLPRSRCPSPPLPLRARSPRPPLPLAPRSWPRSSWADLPLPASVREPSARGPVTVPPLRQLQDYLNACSPAGAITVRYARGRGRSEGRQFAQGPLSMQSMPRSVRHTIAAPRYVDVDIVNCQPTIASQLCAAHGVPMPALDRYLADREQLLRELAASASLSRELAKKAVVAVMNGSNAVPRSAPAWFHAFVAETKLVHAALLSAPDLAPTLRDVRARNPARGNLGGRLLARLFADAEDRVLTCALERLASRGVSTANAVHMFDGFMLPREAFDPPGLEAALVDVNAHVLAATGFAVRFIEKPMDEGVDLSGVSEGIADVRWFGTLCAARAGGPIALSRPSPSKQWTGERHYAAFRDLVAFSAFLGGGAAARLTPHVSEVLADPCLPRRLFLRVHSHSARHAPSEIIEQLLRAVSEFSARCLSPSLTPVIGENAQVSLAAASNGTTTVRAVFYATVPSLVDHLAIATKLVDFVLAARGRFRALVGRNLNGTWHSLLDLGVYREGAELTFATFLEPGIECSLSPHPASSPDPAAHLTIAQAPVDPATVLGLLPRWSEGGLLLDRRNNDLRLVAGVRHFPFTNGEVRSYEAFLNAWAAVSTVFGGPIALVDVGVRDGLAFVTLSPETPCPYAGAPHECARPALGLSVDDANRRAEVVCRKCRVKAHIVIDDSPFARTESMDGVFAGTLHPQSGGIMWAEDYCADAMAPLPRDALLVVIVAQMGAGKSRALVDSLRARAPESALSISYSIELSKKINAQLQNSGLDFQLYREVDVYCIEAPYVTVCLDSIGRVDSDYELVIIDEVQSVLTHFNSPFIKCASAISFKLEAVLTRAKHVLLMDVAADSTAVKIVVDRLEELRGCRAHWVRNRWRRPTNRAAHLVVSDKGGFERGLTQSSLRFRAISRTIGALDAGKNVVHVSNIRKQVVALENVVCSHRPQIEPRSRFHYSAGGTRLSDPAREWRDLRLLAYSPTITSGISFEERQFDSLTAYVDNAPYAPSVDTVVQMLYRVWQLADGNMHILFAYSAAHAHHPFTMRDVSQTLAEEYFLASRYLRTRGINFDGMVTNRGGDAVYDQTRLSWQVLQAFVITRNRGLANGLDILQRTLTEDYGVPVSIEEDSSVVDLRPHAPTLPEYQPSAAHRSPRVTHRPRSTPFPTYRL